MPVVERPEGCTCCPVHRSGTLFLGSEPVEGGWDPGQPSPLIGLGDDPRLAKAERARDAAQAEFEAADARWGALAFKLHQVEAELHKAEGDGRRPRSDQLAEHERLSKDTDRAWQTRQDRAEDALSARQREASLRAELVQKEIDAW